MTVSSFADGSQTAVIGTEHFLSSPNVVGVFQLEVDLNAMVAGDILELRIYKMVRAAGTSRAMAPMRFEGAQPADSLVAVSIPVSNDLTDTNAVRFSLKQVKGTGRAFPWNVLKHA